MCDNKSSNRNRFTRWIDRKKLSKNGHIVYDFWYCNRHDDAYRSRRTTNDNSSKIVSICLQTCAQHMYCELNYIGTRMYDQNKNIVYDNTPPQGWFDMAGGGFEKKWLDNTENIVVDTQTK